MTRQVLVTGAAGYLGSVMCGRFLREGWRVRALDNLLWNQSSLFGLCGEPGFDVVRGDVRDERVMRAALDGIDVVVPLAALVGAPLCDRNPIDATSVNFESIRLLNRLRAKTQLVVYPVTNSGYGTKSGEVHCTEESPLEPISLYGRTKVDAEKLLLDAGNAVTLRLATVFGMSPRMRLDLLVNHFTHAAVTDGYLVLFEKHFQRNFVHIRDVADGFIFAVNHSDAMAGRPYNLGLDSANLTKEELALRIQAQVPNFVIMDSALREDPDKRNYLVSNERLRQAGFEATRSLDDGIAELIKGYRMMPRSAYANV